MKILILSQAIGSKYLEMICDALPKNSEVVLITGSEVDKPDNVTIIKSPRHLPSSLVSRLKCWLQYYFFTIRWSKKNKNNKFDLIYATSNPPINAYLVTKKLKKKFKVPFIYMNWDVYPHIIEETFSSRIVKWICKMWHKINNKVYENVDQMITIGETVANSINSSLKHPINIAIIPIATNTQQLIPVERNKNTFVIDNDLVDKFIVLYSGKMGYGHNISLILGTAEKLKDNKNVSFVFIGSGPGYKLVEDHIRDNNSINISLFSLQPDDVFPYSMACGDIGIVSQENKLAHLFMPSKTYDMMACGLAIVGICSGKDDLSGLIDQYGIGKYISSNNTNELADIIQKLYLDKSLLQKYKVQARNVAVENYNVNCITNMYRILFADFNKGNKT